MGGWLDVAATQNAYRSWPWRTGFVVGYSYNLFYLTKVPRSSRSSVVSLYSQQKEIGSLRGWFRVNKSHICQDLSWSALNSSLREKKFLKNLESCQERGGRARNVTVWLRGLDEKKPQTKPQHKRKRQKKPTKNPTPKATFHKHGISMTNETISAQPPACFDSKQTTLVPTYVFAVSCRSHGSGTSHP